MTHMLYMELLYGVVRILLERDTFPECSMLYIGIENQTTPYGHIQTPEPRPIMQQAWPSRRVSTVRLFPSALYDTLFLACRRGGNVL